MLHIFLGLGLYLFDIITDILVVVRYHEGVQWHHNHTLDERQNIPFSPLEKRSAFQSEENFASSKLADYGGRGSLGPMDDRALGRETLFFTFLFFLLVPNIVYNLISLCLYIIGTIRLK